MIFDIFYIFNQKDGIFYIFNQKRWVFFLIFWYESKGILILTNIFKILFKAISLEHTFYFLLFITFFWYESKGILILYNMIFVFLYSHPTTAFCNEKKRCETWELPSYPVYKNVLFWKNSTFTFFFKLVKNGNCPKVRGVPTFKWSKNVCDKKSEKS